MLEKDRLTFLMQDWNYILEKTVDTFCVLNSSTYLYDVFFLLQLWSWEQACYSLWWILYGTADKNLRCVQVLSAKFLYVTSSYTTWFTHKIPPNKEAKKY